LRASGDYSPAIRYYRAIKIGYIRKSVGMPGRNIEALVASSTETITSIEQALNNHSNGLIIRRVDTRQELHQALASNDWDLVFSDLEFADFSALELLALLDKQGAGTPLVVIAETGVEDIANRCLESGAARVIQINEAHLQRLPELVDSVLRQAGKERERKRIERDLIASKERHLDIFDNTSDLIQCMAPDGSFLYTNSAWRQAMGYSDEEVQSLNLHDILHPDSLVCCQDRFERLMRGETLICITFKFVSKCGETVHLSGDCGSVIREGEMIFTRGIFQNITETVKAEEALLASETRYQALYENAPDIYTTINASGEILSINRVGARLLGYDVDELVGESAANVIHPEDQRAVFEYIEKQFRKPVTDNGIEYRKVRKNGSVLWVHQRVSREPEAEEPRLLVVCRDVTDKRKLQQQLSHQATHDALTNLINRREFERRLRRMLTHASGSPDHHVLCYLDLDQFKVINDTCGHIAGDELLRQIAGLLEGQTRSRDTLARLGGDEFAVLMERCPIDKAADLANKMRETIENFRFHWRSRRFSIGVSIGIVPIQEQHTIEDALSLADSACYAAKEQGRNRVHVYHADDPAVAGQVGDMRWANSITEALEKKQFRLYAQPIHSCCAGSGGERYEILLRLQDGDQAIRPGAFMPAAERYNLSTKIDYWVLDNVIRWFETHADALDRLKLCSVNLSALSLCDDAFLQYALTRLESSAFPHRKICFEITETAAISNLSQAIQFIETLRNAGCRFALDDFGSGLSSFGYLRNLPVDMVKIDGAFIRNIGNNEIDLAMVKSISEIVGKMGKQTTAEYVESAQALSLLKEIGVDFAQGYYLGKPIPLELITHESVRRSGPSISLVRGQ